MKGIEFRNFLYMNRISQDEVARYLGVKRQTVNNWCNKDILTGRILEKARQVIEHFTGNADASDAIKVSHSQDVLRVLNERISEKDGQIALLNDLLREKDGQIAKLLEIIKNCGKKEL